MTKETSRRGFTAGAGLMLLSPNAVRGSQANSALTLGVIGVGNRGTYVTGIFAKNEFCRVAAVADIYDDQLAKASEKFSGAKTFKSAKELLASDVDAVYIATPPYMHPEHFEMAVAARKHIFMEKPAGVDAAGCRRVLAAARKADKTKRISVDYQQRYGVDYRQAYDRVKSGEFGAIKMVRAAWIGGGLPLRSGHAPEQEKIRNWLYYREHSGDIIVEQNCHNLDVVNWFVGTHPVKASGYGARMVRKSPGNILDSLGVTYEFADGMVFSFSASQFTAGGYTDIGEVFLCEKGTVRTTRRGYEVYNKAQRGAPPEIVQSPSSAGDITADAVNAFVDGARTGKLENAGFYAVESTLTAILGREAIYSGKPMNWSDL